MNIDGDMLLTALKETPSANWLAKWIKEGENKDIAELYRLFQQRVLGRAKHLTNLKLRGKTQ